LLAQQIKQPVSFRFSPKLSSQGWRKKLSKKESKANPDSYTLTHLKNIINRVYGNRLSLLKQAQNADDKLYSILRKKFSHKINKTLSKVAIAEKLVIDSETSPITLADSIVAQIDMGLQNTKSKTATMNTHFSSP